MAGVQFPVSEADLVQPVGRLAPSPTGGLHVGHARTFLIAWLMARRANGRVVLRIEDIDTSRVRPGMTDQAMVDLRWIGLDWDEGPDLGGGSAPYLQSQRFDRYKEALETLKHADQVYPCTCTRAEIQRLASAPHLGEEGPVYPGTCAGRSARDELRLTGQRFCWRFRVKDEPIAWDDQFLGRVQFESSSLVGDFIVGRSDGGSSYQLAVVVDDAAMGISQVIRGDDLVSSTPRQLGLYKALELEPPRFGHVSLVVDGEGRRLAKRDESMKLATLREQGVDPSRLTRWLAQSIGIDPAPGSMPLDWIGQFQPEQLPTGPVTLDLPEINPDFQRFDSVKNHI